MFQIIAEFDENDENTVPCINNNNNVTDKAFSIILTGGQCSVNAMFLNTQQLCFFVLFCSTKVALCKYECLLHAASEFCVLFECNFESEGLC